MLHETWQGKTCLALRVDRGTGRVAPSNNLKLGQRLVDLAHLLVGEVHDDGVLADALHCGRARDRDDDRHPRPPTQAAHPVDGQLGGRAAFLLGECLHLLAQAQVLLEALGLEAREVGVPHHLHLEWD